MAPQNGEHVPYEYQGENTNYCWAVAMNGLMNAYAGKKVSNLDMIKNKPIKIPGSAKEAQIPSEEQYIKGVDMVKKMYSGETFGSPLMFGDYILSKLPGTMIKSAQIGIDPEKREYCRQSFLQILKRRLKDGPVAMLHAGHYVLVEGLEGDNLIVRDSLNKTRPDALRYHYSDVTEIFNSDVEYLELVWLEGLKGKESETAAEFGLEYDKDTGEFYRMDHANNQRKKDEPNNSETILHRNGIEGVSSPEWEKDFISYSVYLPKISGKPKVQDEQKNKQAEEKKAPEENKALEENKVVEDNKALEEENQKEEEPAEEVQKVEENLEEAKQKEEEKPAEEV